MAVVAAIITHVLLSPSPMRIVVVIAIVAICRRIALLLELLGRRFVLVWRRVVVLGHVLVIVVGDNLWS